MGEFLIWSKEGKVPSAEHDFKSPERGTEAGNPQRGILLAARLSPGSSVALPGSFYLSPLSQEPNHPSFPAQLGT